MRVRCVVLCSSFPTDSYNLADNSATPAASPPTFSLITPGASAGGVQLYYTNGKMDATNVKTYFQFQCSTSATTSYAPTRTAQDTWTVVVTSPEACATSKPSGSGGKGGGLSGGSIFCIILLVAFTLYVVGGCVFKRTKQGTQGTESMPNIDFWRDLVSRSHSPHGSANLSPVPLIDSALLCAPVICPQPGLVRDGCAFTVAKLRGLCGGHAASKSGSEGYEQM